MSAVAAAFWRSYLRQLPPGHPHGETEVYSVFAFDDTPAVSDELAALVLAGGRRPRPACRSSPRPKACDCPRPAT